MKTGKLIRDERGPQLLFEELPLRDVLDLTDKVQGVALGIADHGDAEQNPYDIAILVEITLLDVVIRDLILDESLHVFEVLFEIVRMGDVPEGLREKLAF